MFTSFRRFPAGFALLALGLATPAMQGAVVVSPGGQSAVEGNSETLLPISLADASVSSMRFQQVYGASEFTSFGMPVFISSIAFRPDGATGNSFSTTLTSISIQLSTTTAAVDGLSTTFASNVGGDATTVFSGSASISSAFTPVGSPKNFDIVFNFSTPFTYDPASGNLLLDIFANSAHSTTSIDAHNDDASIIKDTTSSAYALDSTATSADLVNSLGLVTQFNAVAVPEVGATTLASALLSGLAAVAIRRRRNAAN